ncbi:unnamed protein product, partial [Haemonchus placei]|uniref:Histone-lysine N-methyltransferase SETMAR n=1 Tax=Haemonchus placei TaxID=6290 RepID=A0A0N4W4Y2_HAEPC
VDDKTLQNFVNFVGVDKNFEKATSPSAAASCIAHSNVIKTLKWKTSYCSHAEGRRFRQKADSKKRDSEHLDNGSVVHEDLKMYPHRTQKAAILSASNQQTRVKKCRQLLLRTRNKGHHSIVFSDEKLFTVEQQLLPKDDSGRCSTPVGEFQLQRPPVEIPARLGARPQGQGRPSVV